MVQNFKSTDSGTTRQIIFNKRKELVSDKRSLSSKTGKRREPASNVYSTTITTTVSTYFVSPFHRYHALAHRQTVIQSIR